MHKTNGLDSIVLYESDAKIKQQQRFLCIKVLLEQKLLACQGGKSLMQISEVQQLKTTDHL